MKDSGGWRDKEDFGGDRGPAPQEGEHGPPAEGVGSGGRA